MILLDADYILRYLLNDHPEMFEIAKETINNHSCMILNEVVAEVVYVLERVYKVKKSDTAQAVSNFIAQTLQKSDYDPKPFGYQSLWLLGGLLLDKRDDLRVLKKGV